MPVCILQYNLLLVWWLWKTHWMSLLLNLAKREKKIWIWLKLRTYTYFEIYQIYETLDIFH